MAGYDNSSGRGPGRPHFVITAGGREFLYAYIRKNGCSAFKSLMQGTGAPYGQRHPVPKAVFEEYSTRVFVWRDPIERAVSGFLNKFVQQTGHRDVFRSYWETTGCDPEDARFEDVVASYLSLPDAKIDPHFRGQANHLAPIAYTHAIRLEELSEKIRPIVGDNWAQKCFKQRLNRSSGLKVLNLPEAGQMTTSELNRHFAAGQGLPPLSALVTDNIRRDLMDRYASDVAMVSELSQG